MVVLKILLVFTALLVAYKVPLVSCASLERVPELERESELKSTPAGIHGEEAGPIEGKTTSNEQTTEVLEPSPTQSISNIQTEDKSAPLNDESRTSKFVSSQQINSAPDGTRRKEGEQHTFGNINSAIKYEKPDSITDKGSTDEIQVPEPTKLQNKNPQDKNEYHAPEGESESVKKVVPEMVEIKTPSLSEISMKKTPVTRELLESTTNNNAHTITSSDFAELTGANGNKNQEESSNKIDNTEVKPGTGVELPTEYTNTPILQGTSTNGNLDPENKGNSLDLTEQQTGLYQHRFNEDNIDISGNENPGIKTQTEPSAGTNPTTQDSQSTSGIEVSQLAIRITDELKVYSNEVALAWNDETGRGTGWTAEAASELRTYMDKIVIAQAVNPDCVQEDIEKHAARNKALHDVLETCRAAVKREEWMELQERTKEALNTINGVVQDETSDLNRLMKEGGDVSSKKALIENNAKKKLEEFDMESVKNTLSTLKEKSMNKDEADFRSCINEKPERAMIEDTLKDIMRIKNNCVG